MLQALEHRAIALGYARLVLDTSTRQTAAIALYERHGYARTAEGRHLGMDALYYTKVLKAHTTTIAS
jgi:ribosomal protein S18 acetylase RimI-like enzyme